LQPIDTIPLSALSPPENEGFLDLNGNQYLNWSVTGSWIQSTLNRGQLATRGASQSVSLEIAVPLSDLEFYKLSYRGEVYYPFV
jgi:outer membrane protein insertion porin family